MNMKLNGIIYICVIIPMVSCGVFDKNGNESESYSKSIFEQGSELTSTVYYHLELDYRIDHLDTLTEEGRIRKKVYLEQKEELLRKALDRYEELVADYPESSLYYQALNNKGVLELEFKMYDRARESFLEILESDVDDKEEVMVGYGLMADPYANFRVRAAEMLYEIEFVNKNYVQAKNYLEESTKHTYYHFCGNAYEDKAFWRDLQFSKIEFETGNNEKAAELIVPHLFSYRMMRDYEFSQYCLNLLLGLKSKAELVEVIEGSIEEFHKKPVRPDSDYIGYFITLLGGEIRLDISQPANEEAELQEVQKFVRNQYIYQLLKNE